MEPKILPCSCKHDHQDKIYGSGNRVHNPMTSTKNSCKWRCTVCSKTK